MINGQGVRSFQKLCVVRLISYVLMKIVRKISSAQLHSSYINVAGTHAELTV